MRHFQAPKALGLAASLLCGTAAAAPLPVQSAHVPWEVADHIAKRLGSAPADQAMELAISLPLHDTAALKALIGRLGDPASPDFRAYLSVAAFTARFCPSEAEYAAAEAFAAGHGLTVRNRAANRRVLDVSGRVADVETAFHTTIGIYQHPTEARQFYAPDREPTLDLATPVLHVSGLDDYTLPFTHLMRGHAGHRVQTGSGPDGNFIGSDIRRAYYRASGLDGSGQSLGLLEYKGYNLADVNTYFAQVGEPLNVPIVGVSLNGARLECRGTCDDSEQVLDMEEAISMAPGLKQLVVYVGHTDVSMLNQMAVDNTSKQLSSSWGWHPDPVADDPIFMEFAAQGQSFVDASGDDGYRLKKGAVWPADDSYVTGVGGTDLVTSGPGGPWLKETGWVYSGGGVSPDNIPIPAYQLPFVTAQNQASPTLRNVPDIAGDANTDNYSCYDGGCYGGNGGTSYAAPLWAGFIALVNQRAAAAGSASVGFLNPVLYRLGGTDFYRKAFHDETHGQNKRYSAVPGYDLVTGFGSPHGEALIDALVRGK
jgi:subtilase family serine protease